MSTIKVLSEGLRNKIAAGEVVERPASVVKELVENALDAGSTKITVGISRAGTALIRVSDNGGGMDREDALLAFERYATSKIRTEGDLFALATMGFRGEALSSIAAVSRMRLATARAGDGIGACVENSGGVLTAIKECSAAGTTVEVKDLFFNTPARRKFLKSEATESFHIIDVVTRAALAHPRIGFVLRMEGAETLQLPAAASERERLVQVFGSELVGGLIETERLHEQVRIRAFVSSLAALRGNKTNQYLFINKRPIKDQAVTAAVYRAYEELLPKDKHPVFFLFLDIDPAGVDFNVHPAKREVRFENKSGVFNAVYQTVRTALGALRTERGAEPKEGVSPFHERRSADAPPAEEACLIAEGPSPYLPGSSSAPSFGSRPFLYLGDTLVAVAGEGGLTIVDYHAAHERVNYERFLKGLAGGSLPLLFPQQAALKSGDYRVVLDHRELLGEFGIEVEEFGSGTVIVRSLPEALRDADAVSLLEDIAAALVEREADGQAGEGLGPLDAVRRALAARLACHASVRGKEVPDGPRLEALLAALDRADNPRTCPHGRPTKVVLSLAELKKLFRK